MVVFVAQLLTMGIASGATLLIHEATHEDCMLCKAWMHVPDIDMLYL